MSIEVRKLKDILRSALNTLDMLDDNQKVRLETNTYFLNGARYFLGISGFEGGYCNLSDIEVEDDDEGDE